MLKDKKEKTLTFRLTEKEYEYLTKSAFTMGQTPSKFVRQLIQMAINASIQTEQMLEKKGLEESKQIANI